GGDSSHGSSTSPILIQSVNAAASATTITSSINPSASGQSVIFTATVGGGVGTPTGSVTFKDGSTTLGTGILNGIGTAVFANSGLTSGLHSITAVYGGNSLYGASTSPVLSQSVGMPVDSAKLRAFQMSATKVEAQSSGAATSAAIDAALMEAFSDDATLMVP